MRILITGGAGFIGSHLADTLIAQGHSVVVLDNFLTGRRRNLTQLLGHPAFELIEHDLSQPLPAGLTVDFVFHLASPASPVGYGRHPIETMLVNSIGTHQLLDLCRTNSAGFLLTSTSEIYGDPEIHPQTESYWGNVNPIGPRCCYDESKRYAEALTINYHWLYQLDVRIVRVFNTYGSRSDPDDGRIIPNFVTQALTNQPITVFGDGRQTRSYCHVRDLVDGLVRAAFSAGTTGEVFNLGNPDEHSVLAIAEIVRDLVGSASPIVHTPPRPEEIARRRPDITKAMQQLQWRPQVGLPEGLRETIAWFRRILDEQVTRARS